MFCFHLNSYFFKADKFSLGFVFKANDLCGIALLNYLFAVFKGFLNVTLIKFQLSKCKRTAM